MEPTFYATVIGTLVGLLGTLLVVRQNEIALLKKESRDQKEMDQRLHIAQADFDARLATVNAEQKNKFKLAALDKRMNKHQEAYTLWIELYHSFHSPQAIEIARRCEDWWFNNCLYLEEKPRASFKKALFHVGSYQGYTKEMKEQFWPTIENVGREITEAVDLAFLAEGMETKRIQAPENSSKNTPQ